MHHIGPEAPQARLHPPTGRMFAQLAGQAQQAEGGLQAELLRLDPLRQRGAFRLGYRLAHLAQLQVGAVLAKQQEDVLAALRIDADRLRAFGLVAQDELGLLRVQVGRGDLVGQGGLEQLFAAVLSDAAGFQVGAKAADAHHAGQPLQLHRAGDAWIDVPLPPLHLGFQSLIALVKALQIGEPGHLALGDLVEAALHPGRKAGVHQVGEVLLEQRRHREGGEAGDQGVVLQRGVTTIHDRADDRGVGGGTANAFFLQHLHQRRFAVAGRRLGLVGQGLNALAGGRVAHSQGRQQHLLTLQGGVGIIAALHVGAEEAGEIDALAAGSEAGWAEGRLGGGLQIDRQHREARIRHLAGHGALPDQLVERQIAAVQARLGRGAEGFASGANRLVGLLGVAGLGGVLARLGAEVIGAVLLAHTVAGGLDRLVGEMHRIGAHVGDEAPLVEALGGAHRLAGREAQLAIRLLLQGAGGEGRHGLAQRGLLVHRRHGPGSGGGSLAQGAGLLLPEEVHAASGFEGAGGFIEIGATGDAFAAHVGELRLEAAAGLLEAGLEVPIAAAAEGAAGPFPLHQQPHRHRLHAAGGEAPGHLLPKQRRQGVPHQPIEDAARLLGVHQLHVEVAGGGEGAADRLLGDLVEHHPLHRHRGGEELEQVPADALAFAVLVRGQEQAISALECVLELLDHLFLVLRHHVQRFEVLLGVDAEVGPLLSFLGGGDLAGAVGQVAHMAHGRLDPEGLGQEAPDGAGLGGALDDDQGVGHGMAVNRSLLYRINGQAGPIPGAGWPVSAWHQPCGSLAARVNEPEKPDGFAGGLGWRLKWRQPMPGRGGYSPAPSMIATTWLTLPRLPAPPSRPDFPRAA